MTRRLARSDVRRTVVDRAFSNRSGPPAFCAPPTFDFCARQIEQPRCVVGALHLSIDEAVDRLVTDGPLALFAGKPFSNLFRRPASGEAVHCGVARRVVAFGATTGPSPGLRLGIGWLVANLRPMLRFNSRAMVDGWRSRAVAIFRIDYLSS